MPNLPRSLELILDIAQSIESMQKEGATGPMILHRVSTRLVELKSQLEVHK
jgi:hypothetical protein